MYMHIYLYICISHMCIYICVYISHIDMYAYHRCTCKYIYAYVYHTCVYIYAYVYHTVISTHITHTGHNTYTSYRTSHNPLEFLHIYPQKSPIISGSFAENNTYTSTHTRPRTIRMHFNTLQHTATLCYTATHWIILQRTACPLTA